MARVPFDVGSGVPDPDSSKACCLRRRFLVCECNLELPEVGFLPERYDLIDVDFMFSQRYTDFFVPKSGPPSFGQRDGYGAALGVFVDVAFSVYSLDLGSGEVLASWRLRSVEEVCCLPLSPPVSFFSCSQVGVEPHHSLSLRAA